MVKSLIRTVDRWRFERWLAPALAAATLFALIAMPAQRYATLPAIALVAQPAGAAIVAVVLGALGWVAMRRPARRRPPERPVATKVAKAIMAKPPVPTLRLRRADRHPDAPVREPIRAHRDLGSPFMEVGAEPVRPTIVDIPPPPPVAIETITVARPITAGVRVAPQPEAPVPADPGTLRPRGGRADLSAMIDRLATGLAARASDPAARRASPALASAVAELNRIAARRR